MAENQTADLEYDDQSAVHVTGKDQIYSLAINGEPIKLIYDLHPIASKVMIAAMDAAAARSGGAIARSDSESVLAATLLRYGEEFRRLDELKDYDDDTAFDVFRDLTVEWALDQTHSATVATVFAQLARCREHLHGELVGEEERSRLLELQSLQDQLEGRPEYADHHRRVVASVKALLDSIADRADEGGRDRPAALSYVLGQTDGLRFKPAALAALLTHGKKSVGRELTQTAVQVLTTDETAELLDVDKERLVDRISDLRKKAIDAPHRIRDGHHVSRPADLWVLRSGRGTL